MPSDGAATKATPNKADPRGVRCASEARARTGRLAMSRMRFHEKLRSPSYDKQEPTRRRYGAQPDYALCRLSWENAMDNSDGEQQRDVVSLMG